MNPNLVLSQAQVEERFRKSIAKSKRSNTNHAAGDMDVPGTGNNKAMNRAPPSFTRY